MGFKDRFNIGKGARPEADDEAAPSGPVVTGSLRSKGAAMATVLRKKNILAAGVIAALVISGGAYLAYDLSTSGSGSADATVKPATKPGNLAVPKRIAPPVASVTSVTASTASVATTPGGTPVQQGSQEPLQPAQPTAQQLAFQAAMSGGGQGAAVSWNAAGATGAGTPPATATATPPGASLLQKPKSNVYSTHLVRKEASPYELLQGTVIPATMETGIKSDLPGEITAVVNQPVYNSVSGASVMIPAGSKLVGTYDSKVIAGATRVGVGWTRIEFPNGTYMQIGGMPGADSSGYAGFHDQVDDHTWKIFKNALLLSLIQVGMAVASPTSAMTTTGAMTGNTALTDGEQSLAQTFGQAEAQMMQKSSNIAPTLTIRPGYAFNVVVTKDLVFPGPYKPYKNGNGVTEIAPTAAASAAAPTFANPYN